MVRPRICLRFLGQGFVLVRSMGVMNEVLAQAGKLSSTAKPLVPVQIGRILHRLGLSGNPLGSDQAWVAP